MPLRERKEGKVMLQGSAQHMKIFSLAAGVLGLGLLLSGCGGGGEDTSTSGTTTASGGSGGATPMPGGMGGGGQMPGQTPGTANTAGGTGGAVTASAPKNTAPPPNARPDPFRPWWDTRPIPPPVLSLLSPVRIAAPSSGPGPEVKVEVQEVPDRRVAGILTGNGVYALIEGAGSMEVVKPGDVLADGYRVVKISSSSVTLKKEVGNTTFTQVVPLTDVGSSQTMFGGPRLGGPGGPGLPGGRRGGMDTGGIE
jgi:hypothetical protein